MRRRPLLIAAALALAVGLVALLLFEPLAPAGPGEDEASNPGGRTPSGPVEGTAEAEGPPRSGTSAPAGGGAGEGGTTDPPSEDDGASEGEGGPGEDLPAGDEPLADLEPWPASISPGFVRGRVTDAGGRPVVATVRMRPVDVREGTHSILGYRFRTDDLGRFAVPVDPGLTIFEVDGGEASRWLLVRVPRSGETVEVEVDLASPLRADLTIETRPEPDRAFVRVEPAGTRFERAPRDVRVFPTRVHLDNSPGGRRASTAPDLHLQELRPGRVRVEVLGVDGRGDALRGEATTILEPGTNELRVPLRAAPSIRGRVGEWPEADLVGRIQVAGPGTHWRVRDRTGEIGVGGNRALPGFRVEPGEPFHLVLSRPGTWTVRFRSGTNGVVGSPVEVDVPEEGVSGVSLPLVQPRVVRVWPDRELGDRLGNTVVAGVPGLRGLDVVERADHLAVRLAPDDRVVLFHERRGFVGGEGGDLAGRVRIGEGDRDVDLALGPPARLSGRVLAPDGTSAGAGYDVRVRAVGVGPVPPFEDPWRGEMTGADGAFGPHSLPPGTWRVETDGAEPIEVEVGHGDRREVELRLR